MVQSKKVVFDKLLEAWFFFPVLLNRINNWQNSRRKFSVYYTSSVTIQTVKQCKNTNPELTDVFKSDSIFSKTHAQLFPYHQYSLEDVAGGKKTIGVVSQ
jgi:hypothetical protein